MSASLVGSEMCIRDREKKTEEKVQTETNEELIKTRTERDIFKKLYEQMTERLLERRE
jgi:hypothetical protein